MTYGVEYTSCLASAVSKLGTGEKYPSLHSCPPPRYKTWTQPTSVSPWNIDLSYFDNFDSDLDSITLLVCLELERNPRPCTSHILDAYADEMTRLGSILVGQDGYVQFRQSHSEHPLVKIYDSSLNKTLIG